MNIGVFGGTFNPPHIGHLILAERTVELLKLDKMIFVPAFIPPHKVNYKIADSKHRLSMLELSAKNIPCFEISDLEIKRCGISYTIDTITTLKKKDPNAKFHLIIGEDNVYHFSTWKNYLQIFDLCKINVLSRTTKIKSNIDLPFEFIQTPLIDISSSEIRKRVKQNLPIDFFVVDSVKKYIYKNNLYK